MRLWWYGFTSRPRSRREWLAQREEEATRRIDVVLRPERHARALMALDRQAVPAELDGAGQARWWLAERLAVELAFPPYGRVLAGNDFVAACAVPTTVDDAPGVREVLVEAARLAEVLPEGGVASDANRAGLVARIHGPAWSVVFRFLPTGPFLVCVDDLPDHCWLVDDDSAQAAELVRAVFDGVTLGMKHHVAAQDADR